MRGQRALVTGAAQRLGRAAALSLARSGCDVVVHYRESQAAAEATANDIRALGAQALLVQGSLDNAQDAEAVFKQASAVGPIELLINNASVFPMDTMAEFSETRAIEVLSANTFAPLALSRAFAAQGREGCIINLLDTTVREYDRTHFTYHLSKRLLHTLTRACALEFAPLVRVNAVAPGAVLAPVDKDATYLAARGEDVPLKAYGNADHITEALLYLARSSFVTGQVLYVDGGRHLLGGLYD